MSNTVRSHTTRVQEAPRGLSLPPCTQDCRPHKADLSAAPTSDTAAHAGDPHGDAFEGNVMTEAQDAFSLNSPAHRLHTSTATSSGDDRAGCAARAAKMGSDDASPPPPHATTSSRRKRRADRHLAEPAAAVAVPPKSQQHAEFSKNVAADHNGAKAKRRVRDALRHAEHVQQHQQHQQQQQQQRCVEAAVPMHIHACHNCGAVVGVSDGSAVASVAEGGVPAEAAVQSRHHVPSMLGGISVHSTSTFSLPSPPCSSASRFREFDPSVILGSITPSSNMTNTLSSRPGVNAVTERTPLFGFLPGNSRILSTDAGASVASEVYAPVPVQAALSLLHLEADESCAGRSGSTRTPLPWLPPRPRTSTTSFSTASTNTTGTTAAVVVAVPTSEDGTERCAAAAAASTSLPGSTHAVAPFPPHADRPSSMVNARRSHCFNGSSNASELLTMLSGSATNSVDVGLSGNGPFHLGSRSGPRGRRSRYGGMVGSLTSVVAGPCTNGSGSAQYGVSMLTDGTLLQSRNHPSSSSGPTASYTITSGGSYLTDTSTWLTNGSSANSLSATVAASAGAAPPSHRPPTPVTRRASATTCDASAALLRLPDAPPSLLSKRGEGQPRRCGTATPTASSTSTEEASSCETAVAATADVVDCTEKGEAISLRRPSDRKRSSSVGSSATMHNSRSAAGGVPRVDTLPAVMLAVTSPLPSPPTLRNASATRSPSAEVVAGCVPIKLVTIVPSSPSSRSATTSPVSDETADGAPLPPPQQREETEAEAHHRNTVRWLTCESPSLRSASGGSMRSSLLLRGDPLSWRAGGSANHAHVHGAPQLTSPSHSHSASDALHSPRSTSFHSLPHAGAHVWSADESVDVPMDVCATATAVSTDTQKTDSPCHTTENSLTTDASVIAGCGGECPNLTSAWFRQLNSFSRSRISMSGGAGQRSVGGGGTSWHSSVAALNVASTTNSTLARAATAAATTFVNSTTRTTTTTTTTRTTSAATAATAPRVARTEGSDASAETVKAAATTTVTTTAVSSITCSALHIVKAQRSSGGAPAEAVEGPLGGDGTEAQPVDALLMEDPDAPPFAKAAMRRFREQNTHKGAGVARRADTRTRDPANSPRRTRTHSQNSVAECAVSFVVSTAAVQSCCTTHSFMAEARCLNRSTANSPSPPQDSPPSQSTALVGRHRSHDELEACAEKATNPLKPAPLCPPCIDVMAVVPLSATEIHLPTLRAIKKRHSKKKVAHGRA